MAHPFDVSSINFDGYGFDHRGTLWVRFWLGPPGSPSVIASAADLNMGGNELWHRLGNAGILLGSADKNKILGLIRPRTELNHRFRVVLSLGWSLGYVYPNRVFGAPSCLIEREFADLDLRKYRSVGTLADWQNHVLSFCLGNSRLMFAVLTAFAGPVLALLGIPSFGFQLFGTSSIGKTIILIVAGSVWGCHVGSRQHRGFTENWATTPEGVQPYGRSHNHGFLLLDETRLAGVDRELIKLLPTFVMRLAEGTNKNRLVQVGAGDDSQLVYLGSSNPSLAEIFTAGGVSFDDAYRVRFNDIPADAGCGYGAFETIHDLKGGQTFANELRSRACTYFGAASEAYLDRLAKDRENRRSWLVAGLNRAIARYQDLSPATSAVDGRINHHFAVVYAAGALARRYGILPWSREQLIWAVQTCERAHHEYAAGVRVSLDPIAAVRGYITDNLAQFRKIPDPSVTKDEFARAVGFIYRRVSGTEYVMPTVVFDRQFAHLNSNDVLHALDRAGLLVHGDKLVSKAPIRNSQNEGREWAYRIRGPILDEQ